LLTDTVRLGNTTLGLSMPFRNALDVLILYARAFLYDIFRFPNLGISIARLGLSPTSSWARWIVSQVIVLIR
jgi:hypothetical protein